MSSVDMAQDPLLSGMSRGCTTPRCGAAALVESPFCNAHQADVNPGSGNDPSLKNSLPRVTNFSGRRVVARRGHSRIRMPSSGRASVKPQTSPTPNDVPNRTKVLESQVGTWLSTGKHEARTIPNPIVPKDMNKHTLKDSNIDRSLEQHLISVNTLTFSNSVGEIGADPSSNARPSKQKHHTEVSDRSILSTTVREGKYEDLSDTPEKPIRVFSPVTTHSTSKETQIAQDYEDGSLDGEAARASPLIQDSVSTSEPISNGQSPNKPGWAVTSPAPVSPTQSCGSPNTTNSGEVFDDEIDDADDEDDEPLIRSRFGKRRCAMMGHDDTRSTREPSLEPECNSPQRPQSLAEEPGDDPIPMDLEIPAIASQDRKEGDTHASGISNPSHVDRPTVSSVITRTRRRSETSRANRLADFDSAAFDTLIYQQIQPTILESVLGPTRPLRKAMTSTLDDRLALSVNPAIHRMHNRSEEWVKKKAKEIEDRGGRKAWFGKVHERQRHIRARESEAERERQSALRAGLLPPRQDPQPRVYKRLVDFGDVPEKDLPDYVQSNKAWMKACAWHREVKNQASERHADARRTAKAAKRNPTLQKTAEEAEGSPQAPRTTAEIERHCHVQRTTEEAQRFYMNALKSYAVTSKGSSK